MIGRLSLLFLLTFLIGSGAGGEEKEYIIGPEDVLMITVWQQPDLNATLTVHADGTITHPVMGMIKAANLSPSQLANRITQELAKYNPSVSQVTVSVLQFNSRRVLVLGQVVRPGKYTFNEIPDLLRILSEAGGPTGNAILSQVTIIRADTTAGKTEIVDLERRLREGNLRELPQLHPGDILYIPGTATRPAFSRNVVFVYGEVRSPGIYDLTTEMDLLEAILLAGGTGENAELNNVKIIRREGGVTKVEKVNMKNYLEKGATPRPPLLNAGDTVVVERNRRVWGKIWTGFREAVSVTASIGSLFILYEATRN